jgi:Ni/Co efflux regulator RcnB
MTDNNMKLCECGCKSKVSGRFIKGHNRRKEKQSGIYSLCLCGCNTTILNAKFVQGHNSRMISQESRNKTGEKNSVHMKNFIKENPEIIIERVKQMRAGITDETEIRRKEAATASLQTPEVKEKLSIHATKLWKEQRTKMEEASTKGAQTRFDRKQQYRDANGHGSETWRDNVSKAITQKYIDGGFEWSRGEYISSKSNEAFYYRSSWELQRMQELDADNKVSSWEHEPFNIPYTIDRIKHRYIPDFIIRYNDKTTVIEEVGPKTLKEGTEISIAKSEAAKVYCSEHNFIYRIWQP